MRSQSGILLGVITGMAISGAWLAGGRSTSAQMATPIVSCQARYTISRPVTDSNAGRISDQIFLLDTEYGRTWRLVTKDAELQWVAIPSGPGR